MSSPARSRLPGGERGRRGCGKSRLMTDCLAHHGAECSCVCPGADRVPGDRRADPLEIVGFGGAEAIPARRGDGGSAFGAVASCLRSRSAPVDGCRGGCGALDTRERRAWPPLSRRWWTGRLFGPFLRVARRRAPLPCLTGLAGVDADDRDLSDRPCGATRPRGWPMAFRCVRRRHQETCLERGREGTRCSEQLLLQPQPKMRCRLPASVQEAIAALVGGTGHTSACKPALLAVSATACSDARSAFSGRGRIPHRYGPPPSAVFCPAQASKVTFDRRLRHHHCRRAPSPDRIPLPRAPAAHAPPGRNAPRPSPSPLGPQQGKSTVGRGTRAPLIPDQSRQQRIGPSASKARVWPPAPSRTRSPTKPGSRSVSWRDPAHPNTAGQLPAGTLLNARSARHRERRAGLACRQSQPRRPTCRPAATPCPPQSSIEGVFGRA
jgi:hypothetical protein